MMTITEAARGALSRILRKAGPRQWVLAIDEHFNHELKVRVPGTGMDVVVIADLLVYMDQQTCGRAVGLTCDWAPTTGFDFDNPNVRSCGAPPVLTLLPYIRGNASHGDNGRVFVSPSR